MNQYERAMAGKLFDPRSPELTEKKRRAHKLCREFNALEEDDPRRLPLMRQLLGKLGEHAYFMGDLHFNYGCNTRIGDSFCANYNLMVLDDGPVTIGDHVFLGPNVSPMVTPPQTMTPQAIQTWLPILMPGANSDIETWPSG